MQFYTVVTFLGILVGASSGLTDMKFPPDFEFGASTSSYQIEGAWNVSDKGESIWDRYTHERPDMIADRTTGDVACDSYHLWQRDVEIAAELGLKFYRFSISWPRLLPTGHPNKISEDGKRYYNNLIDGLLEKGIKPLVTLYHFDLPQKLQELGGWANPLIADWFADYARVAFRLFGDRVPTWITINEPSILCFLQYEWGVLPPGEPDPEVGVFLCSKNVLMSHAKAWRVYDKEFRGKYHGKVAITNQIVWVEAKTDEDEYVSEIARQYGGGLYSYPIYSKEGGWPPLIEKLMAEKSKQDGFPSSKLPAFTEEEKKFVKGTYDYYGLNFYTSRVARPARPGEAVGFWPMDGLREFNIVLEARPHWKHSSLWNYSYPEGLRKLLQWIKQQYGDVDIAIIENGYPEEHQGLGDDQRIEYLRDHVEQVLLAIKEDGVNVVKYSVWSMMDNYEWIGGYTIHFGLYEVDFSSPLRTRTARKSARFYADVIRTRSLHTRPNDEL